MFADKDFDEFDRENEHRLKRLWFVGDPHNDFSTVELALDRARQNGSSPRWVILLGDQDLVDRSLAKVPRHRLGREDLSEVPAGDLCCGQP